MAYLQKSIHTVWVINGGNAHDRQKYLALRYE